jgi:N4-(beta-N-acetylglucosaminyl)-L-asparaginase
MTAMRKTTPDPSPVTSPTRRQVITTTAAAAAGLAARHAFAGKSSSSSSDLPVAVASANGLDAVARAVKRMQAGVAPVDAAVEGVGLVEADPNDVTVGYGGLPNSEGVVQLDACCMDGPTMRAGAVAAVERIKHPASLALEVMRRTTRVLLVGDGALRFARTIGFPEEDLLTERARKIWLYWKANMSDRDDWLEAPGQTDDPDVKWFIERYGPIRPTGTINLCAIDANRDLGGTTTTSGLFFKLPGRVGDSPLIGAGLFIDNKVGAAGSTGRGESVIQIAGGHTVVELMRQGESPADACLGALERIVDATRVSYLLDEKGRPSFNVKFYAINKDGEIGSAAIWSGGRFAVCRGNAQAELQDCRYLYLRDEEE